MRKVLVPLLAAVVVAMSLFGVGYADEKKVVDLAAHLQSVSVTIHAGRSQGSGTIFTRGDTNYVWTAGHVVDGLRKTRQIVDPKTGSPRTVVEFDDPQVVSEFKEDGRSVGRVEMDAEVLRYSDADHGEDLALLRIRKKNFLKASVEFYLDDKIPPVGSRMLHVGSLLGQIGSNSLTSGISSQHGRVLNNIVYDQTTCTSFPGSSGGGVYLESDAKYIGMLVRGAGEGFSLYVPARRIREYAARAKVEFALNNKIPVPSEAEIKKTPIEDVGVISGAAQTAGSKAMRLQYPFRINIVEPSIHVQPAAVP